MLVSTNSGGRARCGQAMSSTSNAKFSRCDHQGRFPTAVSSSCAPRHLIRMMSPCRFRSGTYLSCAGNLGSPIRLLFCPGGFAQFEDTGRFHNPRRKAICGPAIKAPQRCPAPFSPLGLAVRRVCSGSKLPPSSRLHSKFGCQLSYLRECRDSTR